MKWLTVGGAFSVFLLCPLSLLAFDSRALDGIYVISIIMVALGSIVALLLLSLVLFLVRRRIGASSRTRACWRYFAWGSRLTGWLVPPSFFLLAWNIRLEHIGLPKPNPNSRDALIFSFAGLVLLLGTALLVEWLGRRIIKNNR